MIRDFFSRLVTSFYVFLPCVLDSPAALRGGLPWVDGVLVMLEDILFTLPRFEALPSLIARYLCLSCFFSSS
jgi:hypothetical protein